MQPIYEDVGELFHGKETDQGEGFPSQTRWERKECGIPLSYFRNRSRCVSIAIESSLAIINIRGMKHYAKEGKRESSFLK